MSQEFTQEYDYAVEATANLVKMSDKNPDMELNFRVLATPEYLTHLIEEKRKLINEKKWGEKTIDSLKKELLNAKDEMEYLNSSIEWLHTDIHHLQDLVKTVYTMAEEFKDTGIYNEDVYDAINDLQNVVRFTVEDMDGSE